MGDRKGGYKARWVLVTNLGWVTVNGVRTFSHALLLVDQGTGERALGGVRFRARGFSTDSALPTFDIELPSIDYGLQLAESRGMEFLSHDGTMTPLARGCIMSVFGSPGKPPVLFELVADIGNIEPIDFEVFEETNPDQRVITKIWDELTRRVLKYWHAPFILLPAQHSAETLRRLHNVQAAKR